MNYGFKVYEKFISEDVVENLLSQTHNYELKNSPKNEKFNNDFVDTKVTQGYIDFS